MRFSLAITTLALLGLGASSASAACHKTTRRSLAARDGQPAGNAAPFAAVKRSDKKIIRRQKGGARLNRTGGHGGNSGGSSSASMTTSAKGNSEPTTAAWSRSSSQTSNAAQATAQPASSSSSSAAASSTSSSSSSGTTYSGTATFFYQEGVAGACGSVHSDSDMVVALQTSMYGSGSYCGKTVVITNTANSESVTATVADECPGCSSSGSLDLSTGAFDAIGDEDTGELSITWYFSD